MGALEVCRYFTRIWCQTPNKKGFIINPYDPYVANMMINGKQMTITWHVNKLKISHVDKK